MSRPDNISVILFDLDDTIYRTKAISPIWAQRIQDYMVEKLGFDKDTVHHEQSTLFAKYGTTLRAFQKLDMKIDVEDYLSHVHDFPEVIDAHCKPDPSLKELLLSLPQRRVVFTAAIKEHAERVLKAMDLHDCFEHIIDLRHVEWATKHEPESFHRALEIVGAEPHECLFFDDSRNNVQTAKSVGLTTVHVTDNGQSDVGHFSVSHLIEIKEKLPFLFNGKEMEPVIVG